MATSINVDRLTLDLPVSLHRTREGDRLSGMDGLSRIDEPSTVTVLSDISFTASDGDRIGILGLNGAGKTTLLRVLSGAFTPTFGHVSVSGTLQSLLNVGLGFEEHASVVENVYLRGTAMGLRMRQLRPRLVDILEFAGLRDKANHQLHTLSSGQRMRLGFSLSTAVQPDILLMDEWIATGDAAFVNRAHERLGERLRDSGIVILASHGTHLIRKFCNRALVLSEGRMVFFGDVEEGLQAYLNQVELASEEQRKQIFNDDPLLFGEQMGLVEQLILDGSELTIEGWAFFSDRPISVISVEVMGQRIDTQKIEALHRSDVLAHIGARSGDYGFRIRVDLSSQQCAKLSAHLVQVRVGKELGKLGQPLALARSAVVRL
jgi:lipopolysaccharide transport system ATP-binding protein